MGGFQILDLCCGSGAIAVSLAYHLKEAKKKTSITASDVSPEALGVAKANAQINGVFKQIRFVEGDLFAAFPKNRKGRGKQQFDLIVSNPPYIPTGVLPTSCVRCGIMNLCWRWTADRTDWIFIYGSWAKPISTLLRTECSFLEIGHDRGRCCLAG